MKIISMIQLDDEDNIQTNTIRDCLGCCAAFFLDRVGVDGSKALARLLSGNTLSRVQMVEALREVYKARARVRERVPDQFFPEELVGQYANRLTEVANIIERWLSRMRDGLFWQD